MKFFRSVIFLTVLLSLMLLSSCKNVQTERKSTVVHEFLCEEIPDSLRLLTYDEGEQLDLQYFSGPYEIDRHFGWENGVVDDGELPDISALCYQTVNGRHLAIRCPRQKNILKWTSARVKMFADWCLNGPGDTIPSVVPLYKTPKSDKEIVDYYAMSLSGGQQKNISEPPDSPIYVEQFAMLLVDAYSTDKFVTMQEYTWYDFGSCGDNTARSWFTIDRRGKVLELSDIIEESKWQEFAHIMIKHLNAYGVPWFDLPRESRYCDLVPILNDRDGCALTPYGVVVYYHPYKVGCGADGQFNALVPYSELEGMLKVKM